jgi:hypothetical protein
MPLARNWNPPNVDAEEYLTDLIAECLRAAEEKDDPEEASAEPVNFDDEVYDEMISDVDNPLRPGYYKHLDKDFAEREWDHYQSQPADENWMDFEPDDYSPHRNELIRDAYEAIRAGDPDAVVQALDILSDDLDLVFPQDEPEQWSQLLLEKEKGADIDHDDTRRRIVLAVNDLCAKLCEIIAANDDALRYVEWRQLEQVIGTSLEGLGFEVQVTPPSKDGGKDIIATCRIRQRLTSYYIEIKHWRSGKRVNAPQIFSFITVNVKEGADGGLFLSSSGYSGEVHSQLSEIGRYNVRLGGRLKIVSLCQHFVRRRRGLWTPTRSLPEILFEGTLTLASCGTTRTPPLNRVVRRT